MPGLALLRLLPAGAWFLIAALLYGGWQHHRAAAAGARAVVAEKQLAQLQADAAQLALQTAARTAARHQEIVHVAQDKAARDRADAVAAGAALRRLRDAAGAAGGGACAAAAGGSAPASRAAVVSAELLDRVGAAAVELAAVADQRGTAGAACERAYQSLKP